MAGGSLQRKTQAETTKVQNVPQDAWHGSCAAKRLLIVNTHICGLRKTHLPLGEWSAFSRILPIWGIASYLSSQEDLEGMDPKEFVKLFTPKYFHWKRSPLTANGVISGKERSLGNR